MTELKPCPFCGSEPRIIEDLSIYWVRCDSLTCGVNAKTIPYNTRENAIKAWNTRAIDRDELLKVADSLDDGWAQFHDDTIMCEDVDAYEQEIAARIRKAVGA